MDLFSPLTSYHLYLALQLRTSQSYWILPPDMPFASQIRSALLDLFPEDSVFLMRSKAKSVGKFQGFVYYRAHIKYLKKIFSGFNQKFSSVWVFNDDRPDVRYLLESLQKKKIESKQVCYVEDGSHPYTYYCLKPRGKWLKKIVGWFLEIDFKGLQKLGQFHGYSSYHFTAPDDLDPSMDWVLSKEISRIEFSKEKFDRYIEVYDIFAETQSIQPDYYVLLPHSSVLSPDHSKLERELSKMTNGSKNLLFKEHPAGESLQDAIAKSMGDGLQFADRRLPVEYLLHKNPPKKGIVSGSGSTFYSLKHTGMNAKLAELKECIVSL